MRPPREECSERDIFTHEEVQKLLAAAPSLEWQTLIILGYFIEARLGDCVRMQWDNVHPEPGVVIYHQKKTGKKVVVPMHYGDIVGSVADAHRLKDLLKGKIEVKIMKKEG